MPDLGTLSPVANDRQQPINTEKDNNPVRINSRTYQQASGSSIAFQAKPSQAQTTTGSVSGGEISPRVQSGVAAAQIIGLHVDTDMKGTAGGNVSGDVKGMEIEMVSDAGSGRTIAGRVNGIRFRTNLDAVVTGNVAPLRVPTGEAAGGQWDALADIDNVAAVFDDTDTNTAGTKRGYLRVIVNGSSRFIRLYDSGV
jgi:hypothetical protein